MLPCVVVVAFIDNVCKQSWTHVPTLMCPNQSTIRGGDLKRSPNLPLFREKSLQENNSWLVHKQPNHFLYDRTGISFKYRTIINGSSQYRYIFTRRRSLFCCGLNTGVLKRKKEKRKYNWNVNIVGQINNNLIFFSNIRYSPTQRGVAVWHSAHRWEDKPAPISGRRWR